MAVGKGEVYVEAFETEGNGFVGAIEGVRRRLPNMEQLFVLKIPFYKLTINNAVGAASRNSYGRKREGR